MKSEILMGGSKDPSMNDNNNNKSKCIIRKNNMNLRILMFHFKKGMPTCKQLHNSENMNMNK